MNLQDTWRNCDKMWEWIAENWDGTVHPADMKIEWLKKNRFTRERKWECFFCDYTVDKDFHVDCSKCPAFGNKSGSFACEHYKTYNWQEEPKAFYRKIHALYQIAKEKYGWEAE